MTKLNDCIGKNVFVVVLIHEAFKTSTYGKLTTLTPTSITLENLLSFETTIPFQKAEMRILRILDDKGDEVDTSVMIEELDLSVRAHNACLLLGISTIKELSEKKLSELRKGPHWGGKSELELIEILKTYGLSFQEE